MSLPIVHHPAYVAPMPPGHRFPMGKFGRLMTHLLQERVVGPAQVRIPKLARSGWLELAHAAEYVAAVLMQSLHHAFQGYGSGFCVFNDVAVAARVLLADGAVERVMVVDLDVHQGDGTAAIFEGDPRVFTFSMHCRTNFPLRKQRSDLDLGLDAGLEDEAYLRLLAEHLPGLLEDVRPDLVFYNAGVDPHALDRLGRLALTEQGLWRRERFVLETCLKAGVPVAGVVGGGYAADLDQLVRLHAILPRVASELLASL
jgi:acetoin utilization deacetylase AcuC-like enzyme